MPKPRNRTGRTRKGSSRASGGFLSLFSSFSTRRKGSQPLLRRLTFSNTAALLVVAVVVVTGISVVLHSYAATTSFSWSGRVTSSQRIKTYTVSPSNTGTVTAKLTWTKTATLSLRLAAADGTVIDQQSGSGPLNLSDAVKQGKYSLTVTWLSGNSRVPFSLSGAVNTVDPTPAPTPTSTPTPAPTSTPTPSPQPGASAWPDATNTGYQPTGVTLHACASLITAAGTYDSCQFNGGVDVRASNVHITRSLINGDVAAYSGFAGEQTGLVISDTTINCGCQSNGSNGTPSAIQEANYTLLRINLYNSGHGAAVKTNVTIQDSYIHGLGGNTEDHKDGIFSGDGTNVTIRHNNIECNDGPVAGCTSAIGLLTDFANITYYTIDNNLLNTNGSYCFYGSGGPQKQFSSNHITFTNNHFGRKDSASCGFYGPVTYFDTSQPGMVWSGNVWDDTNASVPSAY